MSPAEKRRVFERTAMAELRSYKRERAISARRLAVELGASGDAVEDWLSGKTRVPGWVLIAIRVKVAA